MARSAKYRYLQLIEDYIECQDEALLLQVSDLGKALVSAGVPPEEVTEIHEEALERLGQTRSEESQLDLSRRISAPFMEMSVAYGLAFREQHEARNRSDQELRLSEDRFRLVMEKLPDVITVVVEGNIVYYNPALEATLGYDNEEYQGRLLLDLLHPEDREQAAKRAEDILQGGPEPPAPDGPGWF